MRIIRHGTPPNKKLIFRCERCGCVWEATVAEARWERDPADIYQLYMDCPECGEMTEGEFEDGEADD